MGDGDAFDAEHMPGLSEIGCDVLHQSLAEEIDGEHLEDEQHPDRDDQAAE